jgi:hypothetical protein
VRRDGEISPDVGVKPANDMFEVVSGGRDAA